MPRGNSAQRFLLLASLDGPVSRRGRALVRMRGTGGPSPLPSAFRIAIVCPFSWCCSPGPTVTAGTRSSAGAYEVFEGCSDFVRIFEDWAECLKRII